MEEILYGFVHRGRRDGGEQSEEEELGEEMEEIEMDEMVRELRKMKCGKGPGVCEVQVELLKAGGCSIW